MPRRLPPSLARRSWWWVSALFIATPALALTLLGLDAIRAGDLEQRQWLRERQLQITRLASAGLDTAFEREIGEARRRLALSSSPITDRTSPILFERDSRGRLVFPEQRVYIGEAGGAAPGRSLATIEPTVAGLVDRAQAAAAQGRTAEAVGLYRRIRNVPTLRPWADLQRMLLRPGAIASLASTAGGQLTTADVSSPSGIPLAIVISSLAEVMTPAERLQFAPFMESSLRSLRQGRWRLMLDQRRAYDAELRRWLAGTGRDRNTGRDERLERIADAAETIAEAAASPDRLRSRLSAVGEGERRLLIIWTNANEPSTTSAGLAIP